MEILDLGKPIRADIDEFHDDCRRFFGTRSEEILAEPISISVGLEANRSYLSGIECHVWSGPLPTGAMQQISSNVFVATPEQCLLERTRASHETRIAGDLDIIRMGFRLCGTYSLASCDAGGRRRRRAPTPLICRIVEEIPLERRRSRQQPRGVASSLRA
jgi:hypothetical protein